MAAVVTLSCWSTDSTLTVDQVIAFDDFRVSGSESRRKPDLTVTAAWMVSAGGVGTTRQKSAQVLKFQDFNKGDGALLKIDATDLMVLPTPVEG